MTKIDIRRAPVTAQRARPRTETVAFVAGITGFLTWLIRLVLLDRSFDLFGDEILYADIGRSVVHGGFPRFDGGPFLLHGPGFFYLEAGWERLLGNPHSLMGWIYEMRTLNALLAAATAVVLVLLATRAGSLWTGAVVGLLFALDPFCIRQNDRVLLETSMMFWVMLGYLVFISLIGLPSARRGWLRAVGAGLLFGCAVLTKDEGALITLVPLLAAAVLRWGPRLALILVTAGTTVAVYAAYVIVVAANGQFSGLWYAKTLGIQRMIGLIQTTGFHSQGTGSGSLPSRLIAEMGYFGTTYLLLVLAVPMWVVVMRRGGQLQRMLGLLYGAAAVTLAYALVLGTLEEQELYLLIVPSLLIVPVAATLLSGKSRRLSRSAARRRHGILSPIAIIGALALAIVLGVNTVTCVQWLRRPDDGWSQLLSYMAAHLPAGTRVGATDDDITALYGLPGTYQVEVLANPAALSPENVRYVVVEWSQVNEGYSTLSPSEVRHFVAHGWRVFSFSGRTYGDLTLYQLPLPLDRASTGKSRTR
jgi:Dolichyl-phosphate-mannose-protein mannosyltransferase